jgi:beta-galactosidase
MKKIYNVTAITYLARQDGTANGMVKAYEVYLSLDGETWGSAVVSGEFKNTTALQTAKLSKATAGRYMKFVAKSEVNGNAWTSAAEIGIETTGDITGISEIENGKQKIENGVYDLQGRRLQSSISNSPSSQLKKGLYIKNGRKILK